MTDINVTPLRQELSFKLLGWLPDRRSAFYGTALVSFDGLPALRIEIALIMGPKGLFAPFPRSKYGQTLAFTEKAMNARFQQALIADLKKRYPDDFA